MRYSSKLVKSVDLPICGGKNFTRSITDLFPSDVHVLFLWKSRTNRHPQKVNVAYFRGDQVDHASSIQPFQEDLVALVGSLQPEAHQTHQHLCCYLESVVATD